MIEVLVGLEVPNILPGALQPAGRLIWSTLFLLIGTGVIYRMTQKPAPAEETTWAQAMLGAVAVFGLMLIAYGVVPHEWMSYANGELQWSKAKIFLEDNTFLPFTINARAVKDIAVMGIYVVFVSVNVWLIAKWQKRPEAEEQAAETAPESENSSAFGRPVTAKG